MSLDARWATAARAGVEAATGLALATPAAPRGTVGAALGAGRGASIEFMEHREYQPGDDLRRVDWSVYARTDRLAVRLHREEVSPCLDLVLDASRSMDLPGSAKADVALAIAAGLLAAARRAGFAPNLTRAAERAQREPLAPGPVPLIRWTGFTAPDDRAQALHAAIRLTRRQSVRVLITDLLVRADLPALAAALARDAARAVIVQPLAQADLEPPPPGAYRLTDRETGRALEIELDALTAARFRERAASFLAAARAACARAGVTLVTLTAGAAAPPWTRDLLAAGVLVPE